MQIVRAFLLPFHRGSRLPARLAKRARAANGLAASMKWHVLSPLRRPALARLQRAFLFMAQITVEVRMAWWLRPYLRALCICAVLSGRIPDQAKLEAKIKRATRIVVR